MGVFIKEKCVGAVLASPAATNEFYIYSQLTPVLEAYHDQEIGYKSKINHSYRSNLIIMAVFHMLFEFI